MLSSEELPAFGQHHALEGDAVDLFVVTDKRDLAVFGRAGILVAHHNPMRAAIFRHRDDKRVGTIDAFVRLGRVVVSCHELQHDALDGSRFLDKEGGLALGPIVAVITAANFVQNGLGRTQPSGSNQFLDAVLQTGENNGGYVRMNHSKMELVSMQ
jgi:hypothetical protein